MGLFILLGSVLFLLRGLVLLFFAHVPGVFGWVLIIFGIVFIVTVIMMSVMDGPFLGVVVLTLRLRNIGLGTSLILIILVGSAALLVIGGGVL